jgi:DNA-directed RNA polymerase specialized sigma24 family protein
MTGRDYMETIRRVKREIRLLMEQIERDSVIAQGVTAIRYDVDRVQTSPVSDRMGDIVARITETTELLYDRISLLQGLEEDARRLLVNLKPEHERVLVYRYIDDMGWAQVSEKIGYNEKYIFTLRDSALNELDMLINNTISCASSD